MLIYVKYLKPTITCRATLRADLLSEERSAVEIAPRKYEVESTVQAVALALRLSDAIDPDTRRSARCVAQDAKGWYVLCEGVNHAQ